MQTEFSVIEMKMTTSKMGNEISRIAKSWHDERFNWLSDEYISSLKLSFMWTDFRKLKKLFN